VSEEAASAWRETLREAVAANPAPVVGTHFRVAVDVAAARHHLQFPPVDEPRLRFIQLLERYSDVVSILRRPGQDFLVAPAERADLLARQVQDRLFGIRQDFFQAFTIISDNQPFYDKTADRVIWRSVEDGQVVPDSLVSIEPATPATEIELRRDFTQGIQEPSQSLLLKALQDPLPLQAFGRKVQEAKLQIQWHSFRTKRVLARMQRWASEKNIEWKDVWLTQGRPGYSGKDRESAVSAQSGRVDSSHTEREALHMLFSGLDAADIQRIAIPLDLVLKVLSAAKR
jgi:hypothetical protein